MKIITSYKLNLVKINYLLKRINKYIYNGKGCNFEKKLVESKEELILERDLLKTFILINELTSF